MNLRGTSFGNVVELPETATLMGDAAPRARRVLRLGAGVLLKDGRASRLSLAEILSGGRLQAQTEPFFLPFRPTGDSPSSRMENTREAVSLIQDALSGFSVTIGLVIDLSRISLEDPAAFTAEAKALLAACAPLGLPLVPEVSVLCGPDSASDILMDANADALLVSDSIAWSDLPPNAQQVFFRTTASPLAKAGGGYVSGKYLLPLTVEWVRQLKRQFVMKPVIAGGSVLRPQDVNALKEAGTSAIAIGAVRSLRPWNVLRIVRRANAIL